MTQVQKLISWYVKNINQSMFGINKNNAVIKNFD